MGMSVCVNSPLPKWLCLATIVLNKGTVDLRNISAIFNSSLFRNFESSEDDWRRQTQKRINTEIKMDGFDDDEYVYKPEYDGAEADAAQPISKLYSLRRAELPIDWSLKSSLSFDADFQLMWTKTNPQIFNFIDSFTTQQVDFRQLWSNGLDQYSFGLPSSTLPSLRNWRNAFRSLYYSCRLGNCDTFFLKGPEFTVLFHCKQNPTLVPIDANNSNYSCMAFISNATRSFRDKLKHGGDVEVSRLLEEDEEEDEEDDRMFLEVRGNLNVNGLYEVILDHFEGVERDLPILLSRTPFLNATVSRAKVQFANQRTTSRLEVRFENGSWIMPSSTKQLCNALALAAKSTGVRSAFKVSCKYGSDLFPNELMELEDEEDDLCGPIDYEWRNFVSPIKVIKYDTDRDEYTIHSNT